ncbi:MAG TPA: hypothetical protein VN285_09365 [Candidatus Deferrimicrobium sp.]|nr:hypothetical protein [Candidatus Deferrimicrobium sp.]
MSRVAFILVLALIVILAPDPLHAASSITLDGVDGLFTGDTVLAGCPVRFTFRLTNTDGASIRGFSNGFRVWTHQSGVFTDNFGPVTFDTLPLNWRSMIDAGLWKYSFGLDGIGADTIGFGGFSLSKGGIPNRFDEQVWYIEAHSDRDGDTLCIDSSYFRPAGVWLWSTAAGTITPAWYGPYCFHAWLCPCGPPSFASCPSALTLPTCATAYYTFRASGPPGMDVRPYRFRLLSGPGALISINDTTVLWKYVPSASDTNAAYVLTTEVYDGFNCTQCIIDLEFSSSHCSARGNLVATDAYLNASDLTYLVAHLFRSGPPASCSENADVDGNTELNVTDLTYLVDYFVRAGPAPPLCP